MPPKRGPYSPRRRWRKRNFTRSRTPSDDSVTAPQDVVDVEELTVDVDPVVSQDMFASPPRVPPVVPLSPVRAAAVIGSGAYSVEDDGYLNAFNRRKRKESAKRERSVAEWIKTSSPALRIPASADSLVAGDDGGGASGREEPLEGHGDRAGVARSATPKSVRVTFADSAADATKLTPAAAAAAAAAVAEKAEAAAAKAVAQKAQATTPTKAKKAAAADRLGASGRGDTGRALESAPSTTPKAVVHKRSAEAGASERKKKKVKKEKKKRKKHGKKTKHSTERVESDDSEPPRKKHRESPNKDLVRRLELLERRLAGTAPTAPPAAAAATTAATSSGGKGTRAAAAAAAASSETPTKRKGRSAGSKQLTLAQMGFDSEKRACCEYRCPYCLYVHGQRSQTLRHVASSHGTSILQELRGLRDAQIRLENLNRRGVRIVSHERLMVVLGPLRRRIRREDRATLFPLIVRAAKSALAQAMTVVGDELYTGRRFRLIRDQFNSMAGERQWAAQSEDEEVALEQDGQEQQQQQQQQQQEEEEEEEDVIVSSGDDESGGEEGHEESAGEGSGGGDSYTDSTAEDDDGSSSS